MVLGMEHKNTQSSVVWVGNKFKYLPDILLELTSIPHTQGLMGEI